RRSKFPSRCIDTAGRVVAGAPVTRAPEPSLLREAPTATNIHRGRFSLSLRLHLISPTVRSCSVPREISMRRTLTRGLVLLPLLIGSPVVAQVMHNQVPEPTTDGRSLGMPDQQQQADDAMNTDAGRAG